MDTQSFFDELEKIAVTLSKDEERRRAAAFTGLGAVSMPVVSGAANLIQGGRVVPKGVKPARWLASNLFTGSAFGGALPAIQSRISEKTQASAEERLRRKRISRSLKEYHRAQGK